MYRILFLSVPLMMILVIMIDSSKKTPSLPKKIEKNKIKTNPNTHVAPIYEPQTIEAPYSEPISTPTQTKEENSMKHDGETTIPQSSSPIIGQNSEIEGASNSNDNEGPEAKVGVLSEVDYTPKLQVLPMNEDDLSTQDQIEDLKEVVSLFRSELEQIYKDKALAGKYGDDKINDLAEDAAEYLSNPDAFKQSVDPTMVTNVIDFIEATKNIRIKSEKH